MTPAPSTPDPLRGDPYSTDADYLRALIGAFPIIKPKDVTR